MSLIALGPNPIAGGSRDAPSTPATVPHRPSPRAAVPAPPCPGCHTPCCSSRQNLLSKVFPPATSTLPPPLAFPAQLFLLSFLLPFQLALFFSPPFACFLTPSPPFSLSLLALCLECLIRSPSCCPGQHCDNHTLPFP